MAPCCLVLNSLTLGTNGDQSVFPDHTKSGSLYRHTSTSWGFIPWDQTESRLKLKDPSLYLEETFQNTLPMAAAVEFPTRMHQRVNGANKQ
jgi:hypothetical protein